MDTCDSIILLTLQDAVKKRTIAFAMVRSIRIEFFNELLRVFEHHVRVFVRRV